MKEESLPRRVFEGGSPGGLVSEGAGGREVLKGEKSKLLLVTRA